jgi:hypothetical protein
MSTPRRSLREIRDAELAAEKLTEAQILHAIRLDLGREPDLVLWRLGTGAMRTPDGRMVRLGLVPGASDLIGIVAPRGRWIALEAKSPVGRLKQEQERFLALVARMGGVAEVVRSVEEARAALEEARR